MPIRVVEANMIKEWCYWKCSIRKNGRHLPRTTGKKLWTVVFLETGETLFRHRKFSVALKQMKSWQQKRINENV